MSKEKSIIVLGVRIRFKNASSSVEMKFTKGLIHLPEFEGWKKVSVVCSNLSNLS